MDLETQVEQAYGVKEIWADALGEFSHSRPDCTPGTFPVFKWDERGKSPCPNCIVIPGSEPVRSTESTPDVVPIPTQASDWTPPPAAEPVPSNVLSAREAISAWLLGLADKVSDDLVTADLQRAATDWARDYSGDFAFMVDMKAAADKLPAGEVLTTGKARGVLNCWRAEVRRG